MGLRDSLHALAAALALAATPCAAQTPARPALPRTIADVSQLLKQYRPDPAAVSASRDILQRQPPAAGSKRQLLQHHADRAAAAESLGLSQAFLDSRRAAAALSVGEPDEPRFLNDLAAAEAHSGNMIASARLRERLLALPNKGAGDEMSAELFLARVYALLGDLPRARSHLRRGESVIDRYRNMPGTTLYVALWDAFREWARGDLLMAEGRFGNAQASFRRAAEHYEHDLRSLASKRGQSSNVRLESVHASLDLVEGRLIDALVGESRLGEAELVVRALLKRTLERVGNYSPQAGLALVRFGDVLVGQGRFREALTLADAAKSIFDQTGTPGTSVYRLQADHLRARALVGVENWTGADAAFASIVSEAAQDAASRSLVRASGEMGLAWIKAGKAKAAAAAMRNLAAEYAQNFGREHTDTAEVRALHAMAVAADGDKSAALREFREAGAVLLDRPGEAVSSLSLVKRRHALTAYIKLLSEIPPDDPSRKAGFDPESEAFRIADFLRGGLVQQSLAESAARAAAGTAELARLIRLEQDGRQEVAALYDFLLRMLNSPPDQQLPKVMGSMRDRIRQLDKERVSIRAQLSKAFPDYASLTHPRPASLAEARGALRPGEALLSVLSTDQGTFVWSVNERGEASFHVSDIDAAEIGALVAGLRKALDPGDVALAGIPAFDLKAAHRLYATLLAPAERIWSPAHSLIVVTSGALAQIPLSILPTRDVPATPGNGTQFSEYRSVPWLAHKVAVSNVPSLSSLVRLRSLPAGNPGRRAFAGFGDPRFGKESPGATTRGVRMRNLEITRVSSQSSAESPAPAWTEYGRLTPLPDTREEILSIAQVLGADVKQDVFLGAEASKRQVKTLDLHQRRVIAFATHGLVPGDLPGLDQPALALASLDSSDESPLLTLEDVLSLKLDADWVVLSACNTAAADGQGAEAISGLGRGFFYAGSRALLVTHWPVESVSAKLLVTGVFEESARNPALSRAQALNRSILDLMQKNAESAGEKFSYAHPVFWAPYALIGDGGR
jgi:CHAT domain-containing protein